jgi:hypothetical protein
MNKEFGKHLQYTFFTVYILLQAFVLLFGKSEYGFGGADNVAHFQMARYAFRYPELFLNLWGKPVFTTLLAPFSLFGYKIAKSFNILLTILALFVSVKISNHLYPGRWLATAILIAFAPIYFFLATSCLTETLFSLVLVLSVYAFIKERYITSAVILSFLPFVRSEGIVVLPVFVVVLFLVRSYKSIPFLALGAVLYSIIGFFVFGDFLWIINQQPYSMGESIYGSGSLFHFVKKSNYIFGIPLLILIVSGTLYWAFLFVKSKSLRAKESVLFLLIAGSWTVYFAAHSYVWWKGTGGSLGLIRVIGGVLPLAALCGVKTFDFFSTKFRNKNIVSSIIGVFLVMQVVLFFTQNKLLSAVDPTEQLVKKSADYIRFNEEGKKVYYFNPLVNHFLNIDPYDTKQCNWGIADKKQPSNSMEWGDVMVWDAHFGPNEGGVMLENLENDPYLSEIKAFYPLEKVVVLGGYNYSVHIFEKTKNKNSEVPVSTKFEKILDFENGKDDRIIEYDSVYCWKMDKSQEYSPGIVINAEQIIQKEVLDISILVEYFDQDEIDMNEVFLVLSIENNKEHLRYETANLISTETKGWKNATIKCTTPAGLPKTGLISVYVWNKDRKNILLKKVEVKVNSY